MARMTTDELIKQVLDRDAKATPGPWKIYCLYEDNDAGTWAPTHIGTYATREDAQKAAENKSGAFLPVRSQRARWTHEGTRWETYTVYEWKVEGTAAPTDYRTAAPLLARKLQRAMEVLEGIYDGTYDAADTNVFLDEIEAMQ